jgi:hypothetical protein
MSQYEVRCLYTRLFLHLPQQLNPAKLSGGRKSIKRTVQRFTVDMKNELDSLISDCYGEGEVHPLATTPATMDNCNEVSSNTDSQTFHARDTPSIDKKDIPPHTHQVLFDSDIVQPSSTSNIPADIQNKISPLIPSPSNLQNVSPPQEKSPLSIHPSAEKAPLSKEPLKQSTTPESTSPTPRRLVYSRSYTKLTISTDGNGRSSNPALVDANYGKGKQEIQSKSGIFSSHCAFYSR